MVKGQQNTFVGGMNKDDAEESLQRNQYRDAKNGRIVSLMGNTIEYQNLRGDTLYFSLPDTVPGFSQAGFCYEDDGAAVGYEFNITIQQLLCNPVTGNCTWIGGPTTLDNGGSGYDSPLDITALLAEINALDTGTPGEYLVYAELDACGCVTITPLLSGVRVTAFEVSTFTNPGITITDNSVVRPDQSDLRILGSAADEKSLVLFTVSDTYDIPKYYAYLDVSSNGAPGTFQLTSATFCNAPGAGVVVGINTAPQNAVVVADYLNFYQEAATVDYVTFTAVGSTVEIAVDKAWFDANYTTKEFAYVDISTVSIIPASPLPITTEVGYGQIWELDISDGGVPANLGPAPTYYLDVATHMIYSDNLRFTLSNQIYDAEIVRESGSIARVYWTDNYNPPRVLRIGDGFQDISLDLLPLNPLVRLGNIGLSNLTAGTLNEGIYQVAYRLTTDGGASTNISYLSSSIKIAASFSDGYREYVGISPGTATNQGMAIQITNVDQNYDSIELICLLYTIKEGNPVQVWIGSRQQITGSTMIITVSDNIERYDAVTIEEVAIDDPFIKTVKCLKILEDRLYLGNITEGITDIPIDVSGITIAENASYFPSDRIAGANSVTSATTAWTNWIGQDRISGPDGGMDGLGNVSSPTNDFSDYKGAYRGFYNKGYFAGEVYRLGIVFFLKNGSTSKVQWIDDYQFSNRYHQDGALNPTGNIVYVNNLGDEEMGLTEYGLYLTNIDVSGVKDDIIGFSIVRAIRDPRLICQAIITPLTLYGSSIDGGGAFLWADTEYFDINSTGDTFDPAIGGGGSYTRSIATVYDETHALYSPELKLNPGLIQQASNLVIQGYVADRSASYTTRTVINNQVVIYKSYQQSTSPNDITMMTPISVSLPGDATDIVYNRIIAANAPSFIDTNLQGGGVTYIPSYDPIANTRKGPNDDVIYIRTSDALVLPIRGVSQSSPSLGVTWPIETNAIGIANIYNNKDITTLYGGQSDEAIAATTYYTMGHYQPVDACNSNGGTYIFDAVVWGGDCFTTLWDVRTRFSSFPFQSGVDIASVTNPNGEGIYTSGGNGFVVPIQTTINTTQIYGSTLAGPDVAVQPDFDFTNNTSPAQYEEVWSRDVGVKPLIGGAGIDDEPNDLVNVIQASNPKTNGEKKDSFREFPVNERVELEYGLGPINHLDTLRAINSGNPLYGFTPFSVVWVPVNERVVIGSSGEAVIGSGTLFGKPQYISRSAGTFHKGSVCKSDRAFYWFDLSNREIQRLAADGLTPLGKDKKMATYLNDTINTDNIGNLLINTIGIKDNALYAGGIHSVYNSEYGEMLMTAIDSELNGVTLVYGDDVSGFTSIYDVLVPQLYINVWGERMMSPMPQMQGTASSDVVYLHFSSENYNIFYGAEDPAYTEVQFVVNDNIYDTKVMSNMVMTGNRLWSGYEVLSGEQQRWNETVVRHTTSGDFSLYQPRGKRWQGPINRIISSYLENPDGSNAGNIGIYSTGKMRGGYFLVKLRTNAMTLRGIYEVATMFNISKRNR